MAIQWEIGDRLRNRWQICKIIRGGMGVVNVVYDHELRLALAAKTFQDEVFEQSSIIAESFKEEVRAWIGLDLHLNVTEAHFVQNIAGKPYLFLEYVSGGDLSGWIRTPRLSEDVPRVLLFAIQFCDGMTHALSKGIEAHRDIKPQNCLITHDMTLKITDFGLAKAVATSARQRVGGTPEYMAPEQWDNFEQADQRADIYSFGVMLYEMLTGELPFGRRRERDGRDLEFRHKSATPPSLNSDLPALNLIVQTCLAKDPTSRYEKFADVRHQLASIYESLTGEESPPPVAGTALDSERWSNKGVSLHELGQFREALNCFERALESNPLSAAIWNNQGRTMAELGQYQEALVCFGRAFEAGLRNEQLWTNKGSTLAKLGQFEEALVSFECALDCNPRYAEAWDSKGSTLAKLGRSAEALVCSERALELDPRLVEAWYNKGNTLARLARREEALSSFQQAHNLNPRYEQAWCNQGITLAELGRCEEAVACFERALELNPRDEKAWFNKGLTFINCSQEYERALPCFVQANRLGHPRALRLIGLCRQKLGQE